LTGATVGYKVHDQPEVAFPDEGGFGPTKVLLQVGRDVGAIVYKSLSEGFPYQLLCFMLKTILGKLYDCLFQKYLNVLRKATYRILLKSLKFDLLPITRVLPSGAGRWSNRLHIAICFGSGGRNSFEPQNKFLIFEINNELQLPGRRL